MTDTLKGAALAERLRVWLRACGEQPDVVGSALAYELAALVGRYAESQADALEMIDWVAATMRDQIRAFGVGGEHP